MDKILIYLVFFIVTAKFQIFFPLMNQGKNFKLNVSISEFHKCE